MTFIAATITLFLVMDSLGNIPIFIVMLQRVPPRRRLWVVFRESLFALVVLSLFLLSGKFIIHLLQVSESALSIAGGIILFLIAIRLIFPPEKTAEDDFEGEPFLVPMAIPLIAGPAAMATVMLLTSEDQSSMLWAFLVLLTAWLAGLLVLLAAIIFSKRYIQYPM